jgi:hypothetical protein
MSDWDRDSVQVFRRESSIQAHERDLNREKKSSLKKMWDDQKDPRLVFLGRGGGIGVLVGKLVFAYMMFQLLYSNLSKPKRTTYVSLENEHKEVFLFGKIWKLHR